MFLQIFLFIVFWAVFIFVLFDVERVLRIAFVVLSSVLYKISKRNFTKEGSLQTKVFRNQITDAKIIKRYNSHREILSNLELIDQGVTVTGLRFSVSILAIAMAVLFNSIIGGLEFSSVFFYNVYLVIVLIVTFNIFRWIIYTLLRIKGFLYKEGKELYVMDALDIIISGLGISGSIENSISKYISSIDASIRPYFEEFIVAKNLHEPFDFAIEKLRKHLGLRFDSFAKKAIFYNTKGGESLLNIFDDITVNNSIIRQNKERLALVMNEKRQIFIVMVIGVTILHVLISVWNHAFAALLFGQMGRIMLIIDIVIIATVLKRLSKLETDPL